MHKTNQHGRGYVKAVLLAAFGLYFARLIITGNLANYINIHYANYTKAAVVMFLLLSAASLPKSKTHCCPRTLPALSVGIFLIPLLLGFGIVSRPLTAADINDDNPQDTLLYQVGTSSVMTPDLIEDASLLYSNTNEFMPDKPFSTDDPALFTILDWLRLYAKAHDKKILENQSVDLIGFVKHDPRLPDGIFTVTRFYMRHCIFDTFPIGIYVDWKGSAGLKENDWVRIRGRFIVTDADKGSIPIIMADELSLMPVPKIPYLYPETADM